MRSFLRSLPVLAPSGRRAALGLSLLAGLLTVTGTAQAGHVAAARLRVMPLGDSITAGAGSSTGSSYRATLWNLLVGQGHSLDYVGSQNSGALPDTDHEGHSGWRIEQIAGSAPCWVPRYRPNIVTLHLGTNDMNQNYQVATAPARLGALVDQVLAAAPDATVLVASLVPSTDPAVQARIAAFNRQVPGLVAQRRNAGKHVGYVSMSAVTTADLADTLHPNDNGYAKMAAAFDAGIRQALLNGWIADPVPPGPDTCAPSSPGDYRVDINGDGRADYLVVADNGSVRAWLNADGHGGWTSYGQIAGGVGVPGGQVRFADINGDGRADYLTLASNGAVRAWINNGGDGHGGWIDYGQIATGVGAPGSEVRFADINGDGRADYLTLAGNGAVRAWINADGHGGWTSYGQIAGGVGVPAGQVRFADFDGDGRADYLVVADNGAVRVWINNGGDGHGGWTDYGQVAGGVGVPGGRVRFADLNGDGRADYLTLAGNGAIDAWANAGGDGRGGWISYGQVAAGVGAPGNQVRI